MEKVMNPGEILQEIQRVGAKKGTPHLSLEATALDVFITSGVDKLSSPELIQGLQNRGLTEIRTLKKLAVSPFFIKIGETWYLRVPSQNALCTRTIEGALKKVCWEIPAEKAIEFALRGEKIEVLDKSLNNALLECRPSPRQEALKKMKELLDL